MSRRVLITTIGGLLIVLAGCVTKDYFERPPWTVEIPEDTEKYLRFLVVGEGITNRQAEDDAITDLAAQLETRFYDRLVNEVGFGDARLIEDIVETQVETALVSHYSNFIVVDRHSELLDDRRRIYMLINLSREIFERDVEQIIIALSVPPEAPQIAPPEDAATVAGEVIDLLESDGYRLMLQAIDSEQIELTLRSVETAEFILSPEDASLQLGDGETFGATVRAEGIIGTEFVLVYPDGYFIGTTGERVVPLEIIPGESEVSVASPNVVGTFTVILTPEWYHRDRSVINTDVADPVRTALLEIGSTLTRTIDLTVFSRASEIPTAVIVVDTDIAGNLIPSEHTGLSTVRRLADHDFDFTLAEVDRETQLRVLEPELSTQDLYDILPFDLLNDVERIVLGHAWIADFRETEDFSAQVQLEARVFDLRRDRTLLSTEVSGNARGNDSRAVLRGAFQSAGEELAAVLRRRLP